MNLEKVIDSVNLAEGNLDDFNSILSVFGSVRPEIVFHLGAQSFVPTSFRVPIETYVTNIIGTANILEAARKVHSHFQAIHIACSSEEYGLVYPDELPIKESNPLRPRFCAVDHPIVRFR